MKKAKASPTLDLHGLTTDEVYDAIDQFIGKHTNKSRIRIMTGKGKGLVQKVAKDYLKRAGYPFEYEKNNQGQANTGVLVVFMD